MNDFETQERETKNITNAFGSQGRLSTPSSLIDIEPLAKTRKREEEEHSYLCTNPAIGMIVNTKQSSAEEEGGGEKRREGRKASCVGKPGRGEERRV